MGDVMSFAYPLILLGLLVLPVLWFLLRAMPPSPKKVIFGGIGLLLGLQDDTQVAAHTPWWLVVLRLATIAALLIGLAGPHIAPSVSSENPERVLIAIDNGWVSQGQTQINAQVLDMVFEQAREADQTLAVLDLSNPQLPIFVDTQTMQTRDDLLAPKAVVPDFEKGIEVLAALDFSSFDTVWLQDGLSYGGRRQELLQQLEIRGRVRVSNPNRSYFLTDINRKDTEITIVVYRSESLNSETVGIEAYGFDLRGRSAVLENHQVQFQAGELRTEAAFELMPEIMSRVIGFRVSGQTYAAAHRLAPSNMRPREIGLIGGRQLVETDVLLNPNHYLERALGDQVIQLRAGLSDLIRANPDAIIMTDSIGVPDAQALTSWIEQGGVLIRFAGPRMASETVNSLARDPFLPVVLRPGGRSLGGAMTWGSPKQISPFSSDSPFYGLDIPKDLRIYAQVLAQPSPDLEQHVIARLKDGTPLVTRSAIGAGQIVLFHVAANAEWSNLPLSELFLDMLERLSAVAPSDLELTLGAQDIWRPVELMNGKGALFDGKDFAGVRGDSLINAKLNKDFLPGHYVFDGKVATLNINTTEDDLRPMQWPKTVLPFQQDKAEEMEFGPYLLVISLLGLCLDSWIMVFVFATGRRALAGVAMVLALNSIPTNTNAQNVDETQEFTLAHVITGDQRVDDIAHAGLRGLSETLFFRTSVEPGPPRGVDVNKDDLGFYPFLYWPITSSQVQLNDAAYDKLNDYLATGGVILFDTRDADINRGKSNKALLVISERLSIPSLEPVPTDHVLTRAFYLLDGFPGRHSNGDLWVEAALDKGEQVEGLPFRPLNDGVSPILIGGNDWAAAWAIRENGDALLPVGSGFAGERQREMAYRFGVNLIMYVLTGNYKSDQVHVPALLERLGE